MMRTIRCLLLVPLLSALVTAPQAQTKMYKCVSGGHTVYQQTACPVTATAGEAGASAPAASASRAALSRVSVKAERVPAPGAAAGPTSPASR